MQGRKQPEVAVMPVFVRTFLFTIVMPGSVTVWLPWLLLSSGLPHGSPELGPLRFFGLVPLAIGGAFYLWCAWDFATAGRGTPAPWDAPQQLVVRGLYQRVRNPMYVGITALLIGEAVLFECWGLLMYMAVIWLAFNTFVLAYEEPALRERFGASYDEYRRAVPCWIPRLGHVPTREVHRLT
jgi:protein-S-isoprenylcysteine O-methyltransferase Ste14